MSACDANVYSQSSHSLELVVFKALTVCGLISFRQIPRQYIMMALSSNIDLCFDDYVLCKFIRF